MALFAVENKSLSEQVFEQLTGEIVAGRYEVGSTLPAERALSDVFQVNRHVVREALKRLEQVGLVKTAQGGGTRVLDFKRNAGLDLLELLGEYARDSDDASRIWIAVLEMRAAVASDLARLCAIRASDETKQRLMQIVEEMQEVAEGPELLTLDIRFWEEVLEGADNLAYRLAFNSLLRGVSNAVDLTLLLADHELKSSNFREKVAQAIAASNPDLAELETRRTMNEGIAAATDYLAQAATKNSKVVGGKQ